MKIVIVGGGYAGSIAANRVAKKVKDAEITVINPRPEFVERVRLHQQIAGTGTADTPLTDILSAGIHSQVGSVDKIGDGSLVLEDGSALYFDYALIAVGSTVDAPSGTIPVSTWEGAQQAHTELAALPKAATVTVIGGGLTGVETATELAEARSDIHVRLISKGVATSLSARGQARVRKALDRLGVEVIEDTAWETAPGSDGHGGIVRLGSGAELTSDLTLWALFGNVPHLAGRSGLEVNDQGRAIVDEYLRSVSNPRIFAIGDCAAVPGSRMSCATAMPQGAHAADNIAREIEGRALKAYSMGYAGQCVSLGRKDAILQLTNRNDQPRRVHLAGRSTAAIKEVVCRYAKFGSRTATYTWIPGSR